MKSLSARKITAKNVKLTLMVKIIVLYAHIVKRENPYNGWVKKNVAFATNVESVIISMMYFIVKGIKEKVVGENILISKVFKYIIRCFIVNFVMNAIEKTDAKYITLNMRKREVLNYVGFVQDIGH